jgi:carbon-monoxide dehydrogenase large subunit
VRHAARALGIGEDEVQQRGTVPLVPGLEATHFFEPPNIAYSSGAHVALAQVDPDTLAVRLLGYWVSHDSGRLINPTIVEGQLQGAVALGIGNALLEDIRYDAAGQPLGASYMEYALPRSDDVPPIAIDHLETLSPLNPLGLKGVGESGALPVPAVVASAVEDALAGREIRVDRIPLTPATLRRVATNSLGAVRGGQ